MGALPLIRAMHRLHRALGSILALLLATWFASGAVMTFARYPTYSEGERLEHAKTLSASHAPTVPRELRAWLKAGGLGDGSRARLSIIDQQPTWFFRGLDGRPRAIPASDAQIVKHVDQARLLRDLALRLGAPVHSVEVLEEFDQWTVGPYFRPWFPLLRVTLDDHADTQIHVSLQTGEIVQQSTRNERLLAWLGPIPHWIYPAALRHHPGVWRYTVLTLATMGLALSLSGLVAGLHVWRVTRRTQRKRGHGAKPVRDPYLRLHQGLGLLFGLLVSTWLFSGALSLSPFDWSRGAWLEAAELRRIHTVDGDASNALPVAEALAQCRTQLDVRELELVGFAGSVFAICADPHGHTRLVNLRDRAIAATPRLGIGQIAVMAQRWTTHSDRVEAKLSYQADNYHYPTHSDATFTLPFARLSLSDPDQTTYYLDPARLRMLARHTRTTRLTRWLYHGLHSLDLPGLYGHRLLWRSLVILCMISGFTLAMLGFCMSVRRFRRGLRLRAARPKAAPACPLEGP